MSDPIARPASAPAVAQVATPSSSLPSSASVVETVLAELRTGLLAVDTEGAIFLVSASALDLLGIPGEDPRGRPLHDFLRLLVKDGVEIPLDRVGTTPSVGEVFLVGKDGAEIPVHLQIMPIGNGTGSRAGAALLFHDLSAEKRREEELRRKDRLVSLGALSAGVAHEIRNPLSGIGACAQVLRNRLGAEDERIRFTEVILEEVARLDRIVASLLSFASPQPPTLRESRIERSIERSLSLLGTEITERKIEIVSKISPDLPDLYIDPDQIEQVLLNLMQNAIQAMEKGGRLTVSARLSRKPSPQRRTGGRRRTDPALVPVRHEGVESVVEVRIADTGPGMPPERLSRIFDPFFTTRPRGTGLGLSISLSIIREHRGTLTIESKIGAGTVAILGLPLERRRGERRTGK